MDVKAYARDLLVVSEASLPGTLTCTSGPRCPTSQAREGWWRASAPRTSSTWPPRCAASPLP